MAKLERKEFASSGLVRSFQGLPQWFNNWTNAWSLNLGGEVGYGFSEHGETVYIQYGEKVVGWASVRYWGYKLQVVEETLNNDNSITARVRVTPLFWETTEAPSRADGYVVNYVIRVNGQTVWTYNGLTIDDISLAQKDPVEMTLTLPPESYYDGSLLELSVSYPNGEAPSSVSKMGYRLYNPNQRFKPWAVRKGTFRSLTRGWFRRRIDGSWQEKGQPNQNKIRRSGSWQNQGKLGD